MSTTAIQPGKVLSAAQLRQYEEDGYIIVSGLLDGAEIEKIQQIRYRAEKEALEKGAKRREGRASYDLEPLPSDPTGKTLALRKIQEVYLVEPDFAAVAASDKILDITEDLIGPEIYYHSSKLMFKPARGGRRKPWHQDFAYWKDMNTNQVTVWGAIDPATRENGCIQVIPGSHKRGLIPHHHLEDYMIDEAGIAGENIVFAEMAAGDVLFFNVLTLHASAPNHSDKPRLSIIIDFDSQPRPDQKMPYGSNEPIRSKRR